MMLSKRALVHQGGWAPTPRSATVARQSGERATVAPGGLALQPPFNMSRIETNAVRSFRVSRIGCTPRDARCIY